MSTPDHERIWLEPQPGRLEGRQWCQDDVWSDDHEYDEDGLPTEYIRADIAAAQIAEASAERDKEWRAYVDRIRARLLNTDCIMALELWRQFDERTPAPDRQQEPKS